MDVAHIGSIEVTGDKLIACDPCRKTTEEWYNVIIKDMLPGKYNVKATVFDNEETNGWGDRVAELTIQHEKYDKQDYAPMERITDRHNCVGVDTGTACFANLEAYEEFIKDEQAHGRELDRLWRAIDTNEEARAAIYNNIAASSSGIGDGCYDVYVQYADIDGYIKVVSVSIEFLREGA